MGIVDDVKDAYLSGLRYTHNYEEWDEETYDEVDEAVKAAREEETKLRARLAAAERAAVLDGFTHYVGCAACSRLDLGYADEVYCRTCGGILTDEGSLECAPTDLKESR